MRNYIGPPNYTTAERRFLFILVQKFYDGINQNLTNALGVARQNIEQRKMPLKYTSYLGRRHSFHPGILSYDKYLLLDGERDFHSLIQSVPWINQEEQDYILQGGHITNPSKFLKLSDKQIKDRINEYTK